MLEFIIILLPAIYFYVHQFFYELEIPHVMLCNLPFLNMHIFATLTMSVLLSVVPCAILYNKKTSHHRGTNNYFMDHESNKIDKISSTNLWLLPKAVFLPQFSS